MNVVYICVYHGRVKSTPLFPIRVLGVYRNLDKVPENKCIWMRQLFCPIPKDFSTDQDEMFCLLNSEMKREQFDFLCNRVPSFRYNE